jgi:hypothetical protein
MADYALSNLASLMEVGADTARDREELWSMSARAARDLCGARPSMGYALPICAIWTMRSV